MFFSFFSFLLQTGLHWAAKHGNDDLVKMLAGTHKSDVNARTVLLIVNSITEKTNRWLPVFLYWGKFTKHAD